MTCKTHISKSLYNFFDMRDEFVKQIMQIIADDHGKREKRLEFDKSFT